jgi:hypothetical protein
VLRNLRGDVGGWCARGLLSQILGFLLVARLGAVLLRMERIAARFLAGRCWRIEGRLCGTPGLRGGTRVWPGGFCWLIRMVGWQAAGYGSQLRAVLETPEMMALLSASPAAGRALLPVCRMLGIESSGLQPGVSGTPPGAALVRVVAERVRKVRAVVAVEPFRIPLPRGVLSAARRAGFGKIPRS